VTLSGSDTIVHVRQRRGLAETACGETSGESVSSQHLVDHVIPNAQGCCEQVYRRLCVACLAQLGLEKDA